MRTYRELFTVSEFRVLFAGGATSVAGSTMQMLALSALVYATTSSPLLAALAYLAGFAPQALGAATLLSWADRVPPRGFLAAWDCVRAAGALLLAAKVLPVWGIFALIMSLGVVDAVASAVRTAVLVDVLPRDGYVLGRSVLNITVGAMQIVGFGVGGTLLAAVGPRAALLVSAELALATALVTRLGLRPRAPKATGAATIRTTTDGNKRLLGDRTTRSLLLAQWIPNGLIVGAEALFVPYAGDAAGALFVAAAAGMLVGDIVFGRWVPRDLRNRLVIPLRLLLAAPYLLFLLEPAVSVAVAAVGVASIGYAASLALQDQFLAVVPEELRAQGLGLAGSGMMTAQALSATVVGLGAELSTPAISIAGAAVLSLLVTAALAPGLRVRTRVPL
ncbi:MFS transporter [Kribbella sp. VKM Ac-2568]|uniref:MFS transporter n=1 Tax=Kribbella sp. VKM Ac-2568 TaxID=2512219 RepID=UPI001044BB0E|nr:MFS transporter [Kribbella sp. VKM Ac-2568]TCM42520.1 transmembrane secretion effector [Kribbella sp. VKM Ac-2568]